MPFVAVLPDDPDQIRSAVDELIAIVRLRCDLAAVVSAMPTARVEVLRASLSGRTVDAIAADVGLAKRTVERHRALALRAIGVRTLPEAAALLARAGVEIPPLETTRNLRERRAA